VRGRAIDLLRSQTHPPTKRLAPAAAAALCDRDEGPAAAYQRQQEQAEVRQLVDEFGKRVSARDRGLVQLRWIEGRTVAETAAALDLTPAQVWLREHRLRRKCGRLFDQHNGTE
jgi:RNA polymerase sigma factor (sigma-70 family)